MEQYDIAGMSCAACSARVEKAVSAVPGVTACSVNLLTNSMGVEGTASATAIVKAVENAGYGAAQKGAAKSAPADPLADTATPLLRKRLIASLIFLLLLMYLSMGAMLGLPQPAFLAGNHVAAGILQMLLAGIVMVINQRFFISGTKAVLHGAPNMDTLVAMGSGVSFVWSVWALLSMTAMHGTDGHPMLYFESAAMIVTLITVGKLLEAISKGKTTSALKSLMQLAPKTARVLRDGKEQEIPAAQVLRGDIFLVKPGDSIPVDGIVLEGESAVNEAALTGESIPADKSPGSAVSAATVNQSGFLRCEATAVGEDTALAGIIRMVSEASSTKAPIARTADRVAGIFVPAVIGIAIVTLVIWLLLGQTAGFALERAIAVLVISCPCALGLATPVAIMVGSGRAARSGILFKTAAALEAAGKTDIVVLDKTGTLTEGVPAVTDVIPAEGISEEQLLTAAASLEQHSEHPLAGAILRYTAEKGIRSGELTGFQAHPGGGVAGVQNGRRLLGGNARLLSQTVQLSPELQQQADTLAAAGKTPLFFAEDTQVLGLITAADVLKPDAAEAVHALQGMGLRVVMLTGDTEHTARAIAAQAGVDEVIAGVLPEGKAAAVKRLSKEGSVAMVGDGINDAPALTVASTGIAIGAGTDIAIDAADVVLMRRSLQDVPAAIRMGRAVLRNIRENLFWAFLYNCIGIPLAAGAFAGLTGWTLPPMFGAAAMSLSSFCVVTNALRLNLFDLHSAKHDKCRKIKQRSTKEEIAMQKTIRIEGMMCPHCEANVKKALEALDAVETAEVSHEQGTAVVTLTAPADDALLRQTVEDKGYTVTAIA